MLLFLQQSILHSRRIYGMLPGIGLLFPLASVAADQPAQNEPVPQPASSVPAVQSELLDTIDTSRNYVSGKFMDFVTDVDRFFGGNRNFQETNNSVLQLEWQQLMEPGGKVKNVLSGRAKVTLPETEKHLQHLHLLLESDPDKNTANVQQGGIVPVDGATGKVPESYSAALRYDREKMEENPWNFRADAGLKFSGINTRPFARTWGSFSAPLSEWRFKATETLFWFNTTGAGETTQLDFERMLSNNVLVRSSSNLTWLKEKDEFDARQDVSDYHTLSERDAVLYQAIVLGTSQPRWQATDCVALLLYRRRMHRKWLYLEISPQLHFPKEKSYRATPQLFLRLQVSFDESK